MSLKSRTKKLERATRLRSILLLYPDGTSESFPEAVIEDAFLNMMSRARAHHDAEDMPERHPFISGLRRAVNVEDLVPEHGSILLMMVGEDEIHCGERERLGPTVMEASPGVYS